MPLSVLARALPLRNLFVMSKTKNILNKWLLRFLYLASLTPPKLNYGWGLRSAFLFNKKQGAPEQGKEKGE
jgi:hypothetical protein